MKLLKLLSSRMFITSTLILIQLIWFVVFIMKLTTYYGWMSEVFSVLSLIIVLYIIGKDENASYKIEWIILIMALPLFGGLLYLFFGNKRPSKNMRLKLKKEHKKISEFMVQDRGIFNEIFKINERALGTFKYIYEKCSYPLYNNSFTTYYSLGEEMYKDILSELEKAKHFIFLEYFIIEEGVMWENILKILIKKVKSGLDVRIIYDDIGSLSFLPNDFSKKMENMGIKCMVFNRFRPVLSLAMNNRDHRKILVIDGITSFNGGVNLGDEYINKRRRYGHWKDTGIKVTGNASWSFTLMFLEMWNTFRKSYDNIENFMPNFSYKENYQLDGYVQPFSDSPLDSERIGVNVYMELLSQAKRYVYIFTPYLVIDNEMRSAICMAAKRGVDVRIITPGIPDKKLVYRLTRSNYVPLLKAGVKIYEYTPGFIHGKSYVCDDEIAVVGTINMDYRSLYLHFECGTIIYKTKSVMDLKKDSLETIAISKEISLNDCKHALLGTIIDAVLRVFAPLF